MVEIKASYGDVYCGGSDLDKLVADWIVAEFKKTTGADASKDPMAMSRIMEAAEKAKIELSTSTKAEVNLPYLMPVDGVPQHFVESLSKAKFESLIDKEITKVINCGKEALKKAEMESKELDGILLVGGSTRIPYVQERLEKEFGVTLIKSVNPDEAVAMGAAVQGSILAGENNDVILLDVTPLNLGIETLGGLMTNVVDANTTIPVKKSQIFSTAVDNQPGVEIKVLQGNRPMAKDNKQIGIFHLDGIAPAPAHVPQIEVTFDIDANGILSVSAVDKGTNKEQHITIEAKGSLTDDEIERMKKEAEEFAESDKNAKETAEAINGAEAFCFQIEKSLADFGDKVTEDEKKEITDLMEPVKKAVAERNGDGLEALMKPLQEKWYALATKIYAQQAPPQDTQPNGEQKTDEQNADTEAK